MKKITLQINADFIANEDWEAKLNSISKKRFQRKLESHFYNLVKKEMNQIVDNNKTKIKCKTIIESEEN